MNTHSLELPAGGLSDGAVAVGPYRAADAGPLLVGVGDADVVRFANVRWAALTEPELVERMADWAERARSGVSLNAAIRDARSDALLGHLVVFGVDHANRRGEIGFWLLSAARGRGATARAVALVTGWLLDEVGLERVQAVTDVDNVASQRTLERAGFIREGVLRSYFPAPDGGRLDYVSYSVVAGDTESPQIADA